jgi:hypothetical protein
MTGRFRRESQHHRQEDDDENLLQAEDEPREIFTHNICKWAFSLFQQKTRRSTVRDQSPAYLVGIPLFAWPALAECRRA